MFVLKRRLLIQEQVHHIDKDRCNDKPSNLIVCEQDTHPILDALSVLQFEKILQAKHYKEHPRLESAVWLSDYVDDYPQIYVDACSWWKRMMVKWDNEQYFKDSPPTNTFERPIR
jgi:hypothetical protein